MTEQEQFLETVRQVLKPKEPSNLSPTRISAAKMSQKLSTFAVELETKMQKVNEMASGYINSRNPSEEEIQYIKQEVGRIFTQFKMSFNN